MHKLLFLVGVLILISSCSKEDDQIFNAFVFPEEIRFDKFTSELEMPITNNSSKSLMVRLIFNEVVNNRMGNDWMVPIQAGETFKINLVVDRQLVTSDLYSMEIEVYIHAIDKSLQIPVVVESVRPQQIPLNFDILDADFNEKENKIIGISANPENALVVFNPENGEAQKVALNSKPLSFHYNSEIDKVVIAQQNQFSIIDLTTMELVVTPFDIGPGQVFLFNDTMLYAAQASISNRLLINLKTQETTVSGFHGNLRMKFHPHLNNCVLASGINSYPSTIHTLDYSAFDLEEVHASARSGDEKDIHDNFWITNYNDRIIAKGRGLFKCTSGEDDLDFVKVLEEGAYINAFAHLDQFNKIVTINRYSLQPGYPDQNNFVFYDDTSFEPNWKIPVPGFPADLYYENHRSTEGFFLFTNSNQTKLYALVTLGTHLSEGNKWKLLVYETDEIFN